MPFHISEDRTALRTALALAHTCPDHKLMLGFGVERCVGGSLEFWGCLGL